MTILREFSTVGPCIRLGEVIKQTATSVTYRDLLSGAISRRGGYRLECGLLHTTPCVSCRDHQNTQYPNGYEN